MSGIEFVQGSVVRNSGDVFVVSIKAKEGGKSRTGIPSSNQRVIVELQASLIIVMMFWLCGFRWFVYNLILVLDTTWRKTSFTSPPFFSYRFPWWFPLAAIMQGQIRRRISVDIELHWRNCCHCLCTLRRRTIYNDAENNDKDEEIRKKRDKQQLMTSWLLDLPRWHCSSSGKSCCRSYQSLWVECKCTHHLKSHQYII